MKTKGIKTNTLYYYANEYRKLMTDETEIEKINMTEILEKEEDEMIKQGEIIIENQTAKMRLGKSTMAFARAIRIHEKLKEYGKLDINDKFGMKNIARDDQEFSKMMRNPKLNNTIIVTDESNELEHTGENVTVENALKKVFSDVQAGRYVHRINCSPKEIIDDNTDIMLSIIAVDRINKITRAKLYYRYYEGGQQYTQLLGYVDTYVGDLIKNWDEIKDIFLKTEKTKEEEEKIKEYAKKDWYVEYMIKKYEKMNLITQEGIFRPRILDYASTILKVTEKLKPLCKMSTIVNHNIVRNYIKMHFRQEKIPTSIVGEELATREVTGILDLWKAYFKISKEISGVHKKLLNPKTKQEETEQLKYKETELIELRDTLLNTAKIQEAELQHYMTINKKYHERIS